MEQVFIHPTAEVFPDAVVGAGSILLPNIIIGRFAMIGVGNKD